MADGTISFAEGLGSRAQGSNEIRRKQLSNLQNPKCSFHLEQEDPSSPISVNPQIISTSQPNPTEDIDLQSSRTRSVQASSPNGFGAHSPKSPKSTSPARKLQQVFFEEGLRIDVEAAITGLVPTASTNGTGANTPNPQLSPKAAQKIQQAAFNDGLVKEAEARARVVHLHGNTYQFQRTPSECTTDNFTQFRIPQSNIQNNRTDAELQNYQDDT
ncbi:hypothetical protein RHGRI_004974 [Rhododendron griersonianum]|uniref:Uncharacterized protein n=1 Tax=Rhododendron griersonianum TaxID=479676 RepID=A0AAV6LAV8_9ERIC|nr:hypothetical protein RHGRI_004974 [Rhododendron griersonianum]